MQDVLEQPDAGADVTNDSETDREAVIMVNFDEEDKADEATAQQKTANLKLDFDKEDVEFWFAQLEMHLATAGVKAQWTKRLQLHKQLPPEVVAELKDLLRKSKAAAGATPYKDLKDRILETFATKPEDVYYEAESLIMKGKPSQLLKQLINKICPSHPNLEGCCAAGMISGMWRKRLPTEVRQAVAGKPVVGTDAMKDNLRVADAVFATMGALPIAALLDDSADAPALQQVAAVKLNQNKKKVTSGGQKPKQQTRSATPHTPGTPNTVCNTHWKYGREAFTCCKTDSCPWAHLVTKK